MRNLEELSLGQLRTLQLLIQEHSLTRAAALLDTSQPALSKTLAKLRRMFHDPLFIRIGLSMEPTPKAMELAGTISRILSEAESLEAAPAPFDAATSSRRFHLGVRDSGAMRFLPRVMTYLATHAPGVRISVVDLESQNSPAKLESGELDIAVGHIPVLPQGIRRQLLYSDGFICLLRKDHPEAARIHQRKIFLNQKHVVVTGSLAGHPTIRLASKVLESMLDGRRIALTVPNFAAAAMVAKKTDMILTMPARLGRELAQELDLMAVEAPVELPAVQVTQYWHERYDRDPGNRWIRSVFLELFGRVDKRSKSSAPSGWESSESAAQTLVAAGV